MAVPRPLHSLLAGGAAAAASAAGEQERRRDHRRKPARRTKGARLVIRSSPLIRRHRRERPIDAVCGWALRRVERTAGQATCTDVDLIALTRRHARWLIGVWNDPVVWPRSALV
jgi:hypothetical protein